MSFNNYPKVEWNNSNELLNFSKSINNKALLNEIINFSKSTKLWESIDMPDWKKTGLNDVKLETKNIEENIDFEKIKGHYKGDTLYDDFGPVKIRLNSDLIDHLNVPTYSQVLIQELGNAKNWKQIKKITPKKLTKLEYVKKIEKIEFDIRIQIINAYESGDFDSKKYKKQKCIFSTEITDFNEYFDSEKNKKHRAKYEKEWDDYHKN